MDASKTVFIDQTAVVVVTKGIYSAMSVIPRDSFGNTAAISQEELTVEIRKVRYYNYACSYIAVGGDESTCMFQNVCSRIFEYLFYAGLCMWSQLFVVVVMVICTCRRIKGAVYIHVCVCIDVLINVQCSLSKS